VGLAEPIVGHASESAVHVHELRHARLLAVAGWDDFSLDRSGGRFIGQMT
jgi:hypothetical protein